MTPWKLAISILQAGVVSQLLALAIGGLVQTLRSGDVGGLFAVLALPMTLAFFGLPVLIWSVLVIPPTYYAFSWFGRRELAPAVVFAIGAAIFAYLAIARPAPSGAIPGYDQTALAFIAATYVTWALYAFFWVKLRRA
jgi:hypothetical protein